MEYTTRTAPLAAYLVAAKKLKLIRIEANPAFATCVFDDPSAIGDMLELQYLSDEAMVPAQAYHAALRLVRRKIEIALAAARKTGTGSRIGGDRD